MIPLSWAASPFCFVRELWIQLYRNLQCLRDKRLPRFFLKSLLSNFREYHCKKKLSKHYKVIVFSKIKWSNFLLPCLDKTNIFWKKYGELLDPYFVFQTCHITMICLYMKFDAYLLRKSIFQGESKHFSVLKIMGFRYGRVYNIINLKFIRT